MLCEYIQKKTNAAIENRYCFITFMADWSIFIMLLKSRLATFISMLAFVVEFKAAFMVALYC